jgi:DNA modification methylase
LNINKLYNEDCLSTLSRIDNLSVDLIITDPPYFRILKKEEWDRFKNLDEYLLWSEEYLTECVNKLRLSGTLLLFGCTRNFNVLAELNRILISNGMYFVQEIVLDKGLRSVAGRTSNKIKMLPPVTESILVYRKDAKPFVKKLLREKQKESDLTVNEIKTALGFPLNGGGNWTKYCGDTEFPLLPTLEHWNNLREIFKINMPYEKIQETYNSQMRLTNVWSDINFYIKGRKHPSEKPVQLADRYINIFSNENDLVYIPFAGSGSEIESCINNQRNYIASELNVNYYNEIIVPRIQRIVYIT